MESMENCLLALDCVAVLQGSQSLSHLSPPLHLVFSSGEGLVRDLINNHI